MFYSLLDRDPVLDAISLQLGPLIVARQLFALRSLLSACRIRNQVSVMKLLTYIVLVYAMTAACVHGAEEQQQQCSMQSEAVFGPKVHFPDDGQYNDNVREVLLAMGFTSTENAAGVQQRCCMLACVYLNISRLSTQPVSRTSWTDNSDYMLFLQSGSEQFKASRAITQAMVPLLLVEWAMSAGPSPLHTQAMGLHACRAVTC